MKKMLEEQMYARCPKTKLGYNVRCQKKTHNLFLLEQILLEQIPFEQKSPDLKTKDNFPSLKNEANK